MMSLGYRLFRMLEFAVLDKLFHIKSFYLSVLYLVIFTPESSEEYQCKLNRIPRKLELSNVSGNSMLQDSEGFIWFASDIRLFQCDGTSYNNFIVWLNK